MNNLSYYPLENKKLVIRSPVIKPSNSYNKFSIFMKRKETVSKIHSDLQKKNSNNRDNSEDSSKSKDKSKPIRVERRISSLKENKNLLFSRLWAQMQPKNKKIRNALREEIYLDLRNRSRRNSGKASKRTSKERVTIKRQPIENNPIKKFSIDSAEEICLITNYPHYIRDTINLQKVFDDLNILSGEIETITSEMITNELLLAKEKESFVIYSEELKTTRDFRNEMIAEIHRLKNEVDVMKSIHNSIKTPSEKDKTVSDDKSMMTSLSGNGVLSSTKCETNYDVMIDELENKLSTMKLENSKFLESYDLVTTQCKENEEKNKAIKLGIANVDELIKGLTKDKKSLKTKFK